MTLDEFMQELRRNVDTFEEDWRGNNRDFPDEHPMEMEAGDWDEQFSMYCSGGG